MSADNSGGEFSSAFKTASSIFEIDLSIAKAISEYVIFTTLGIPETKSLPLISKSSGASFNSVIAEPTSIFIFSADLSPINKLCCLFI